MECPKCGSSNVDGVENCWNCGGPVKAASAFEAPPKAGIASAPGATPRIELRLGANAAALVEAASGSASEPDAPTSRPAPGLQPAYAGPGMAAFPAAYPFPPAGVLAAPAAPPGLPGAYLQQPIYATGGAQVGVLPPPPLTYPIVHPYAPTYRPGEVVAEHASFGWRLAAWALDTIILNVAGFIIGFPIGLAFGVAGAAKGMGEEQVANVANLIALPLSFLVTFLYCTALLAWRGQTVGMMACSLKVVKTDGMPIGFGTAVLRWICYFIAAMPCGLGLLWMIWDPESQGWHDKLAGTYVVRVP